MARLRALHITIDTMPTSVLILDQATPDQASMVGAIPTEALREAGLPPILAFPFEVELPTEHSTHDAVKNADAQQAADNVINVLRDGGAAKRTRRRHKS